MWQQGALHYQLSFQWISASVQVEMDIALGTNKLLVLMHPRCKHLFRHAIISLLSQFGWLHTYHEICKNIHKKRKVYSGLFCVTFLLFPFCARVDIHAKTQKDFVVYFFHSINKTWNSHEMQKVFSECFVFCASFCKNIREIPAKCEIQKCIAGLTKEAQKSPISRVARMDKDSTGWRGS